MAQRRKIALRYVYDENWIGGTYYIQNLVSAINQLPDHKKPQLVIFTQEEKDFNQLRSITNYPYLSHGSYSRRLSIPERIINKVSRKTFKSNFISSFQRDLTVVFPAADEERFKKKQTFLYWIPDFQEHYLPDFFSREEIEHRKCYQKNIVNKARYILFSSQSAKEDFNNIYPKNKLQQFVIPFAVTHSQQNIDSKNIIKKYQLPDEYFIVSNQFWKHKNHLVVLKAVALLKKKGTSIVVVFTGKESDYRNPLYFESLKKEVIELGIENNIIFLGFIPREDQLALMQESIAVIQPSLFEGWSTVVEDAKSLNIPILASDINVHHEQLKNYPVNFFFDPNIEEELSECIKVVRNLSASIDYDYGKDVINYGNSFLQIVDSLTNE